MKHLTCITHTIITLLALTACELPTKVGELSDGGVEPSTSDSGADTEGTEGATSVGQTEGIDETTTTTKPEPSTAGSLTEGTTAETETEGKPDCEGLDEESCLVGECQAHYGVAYNFPSCSTGQVFLGCSDPQDCDDVETNFCREGTESEEAYKLPSSCAPAGFVECEPSSATFCGGDGCTALDEAGCLAEPSECQPIYGAQHTEALGLACVNYNELEFLGCIANGGACPPFVPTVCPIGSPVAYDSPSGCIPPGFEMCEGGGGPECP